MTFYTEMRSMTSEMLTKYGKPMTITTEIDKTTSDEDGSTISNKLSTMVWGIETEFSDIFKSANSPIKKGDKTITITPDQGKPKIGDTLLSQGVLHKVISVKENNPGGTVIYYELRARSYALAETTDTLTTKLGFLEPGAIVADIDRDGLASWRVAAHNHYLPGYTTLVMDKLFSKEQQAFTGSGGYPTKPWDRTWMRKYLLSVVANELSPKMLASIKAVNIITNNGITSDTIYLLSKSELGGVEAVGMDSGSAMPYFNLDSKRISTFGGTNSTYWTREGSGIGTDGKFVLTNPAYAYGVRPAINIMSALEVALNLGGEYEIQW